MSKISRDRLSRGVKLQRDHAFDHLSAAATELSGSITQDQLREGLSSFRLQFHVPVLGGSLYVGTAGSYMLPFVLPPLQDEFDTDGQPDLATTPVVLDEIQLSFDQRGEAVAIVDLGLADEGKVDGDVVLDDVFTGETPPLQLILREKHMQVFDADAPVVPEREVTSIEVGWAAFEGRALRLNPLVRDNLNLVMHPYRTYVLYVHANALWNDGTDTYCLPSLNIVLRFRSPLTARDAGAANVQNIPDTHNGSPTSASVSVSVPAADTTIEADSADGVHTALGAIDDELLGKLRGGMTEESDFDPTVHLSEDGVYSVIAVPLFGFGEAVYKDSGGSHNLARLPFITGTYNSPATDRRIIHLKHPFVLHHVVAVQNFAADINDLLARPTVANFITQVGVGLGVGLRADDYKYQQLAYASWGADDASAYLIDQIKERRGGLMTSDAADIDILNIPLVWAAGNTGTTYPVSGFSTGKPIFCGRANSLTQSRSNVASGIGGAMGPSAITGQDQFIEVRWLFKDTVNGLDHAASYPNSTVYVGYGGHWVLLIGRRYLA